jgi:GNAT superfamily N-acetyltransferase
MNASIRLFQPADIPAAMALVRQAGWNQTPSDWTRFLRAQPNGCFAATVDGRLVGSVTTIVYEPAGEPVPQGKRRAVTPASLAWVGMLLVDVPHRGAGIGTLLLVRALEFLDRLGIACVKLDATPEGKGLYEKHGFVMEQAVERWELERTPSLPAVERRRLSPPLEAIILVDRRLFGADRGDLLRSVSAEAPDLTIDVSVGGRITGYACGRRGTRADHLGPWMAHDASTGERVLRLFLERSDQPRLYVDVLKNNPWSSRVVEANGFRLSRPLTRMYRGSPVVPGQTRLLGAIVGPEFG